LVILIGEPGQGKSQVIEKLTLESAILPLVLEGRVITGRHDAILRLTGMVGFRPEGSDTDMLMQLQQKHPSGIESGVPEIIVEDANELPIEVLMLFYELVTGAYGRTWTVLFVGEPDLLPRLLAAEPVPVIPSVVRLPRWDVHDLEDALASQTQDLPSPQVLSALVSRSGHAPKQLVQQALHDTSSQYASRGPDPKEGVHPPPLPVVKWLVFVAIAIVIGLGALLIWELTDDVPPTEPPQRIPLPETTVSEPADSFAQ
jgi:hypothetical protein